MIELSFKLVKNNLQGKVLAFIYVNLDYLYILEIEKFKRMNRLLETVNAHTKCLLKWQSGMLVFIGYIPRFLVLDCSVVAAMGLPLVHQSSSYIWFGTGEWEWFQCSLCFSISIFLNHNKAPRLDLYSIVIMYMYPH